MMWLKCPHCGGILKTASGTRGMMDGSYIYRMRKCLHCRRSSPTRERLAISDYETELTSTKKLELIRKIIK